jgi:hypothetical protein
MALGKKTSPLVCPLLLGLLFGLAVPLPCSAQDLNTVARLLAGLPAGGTPWSEAIMANPAWIGHASEMEKGWQYTVRRQLIPLEGWAARYLGSTHQTTLPVYYPFSGPDILYPLAFFPRASTYVLCGLEPVGPLPRIEDLPPEVLAWELARLRKALDPLLKWSFFITKDMRAELTSGRISGVLPVFCLLLARTGAMLEQVDYVSLGSDGKLAPQGGGSVHGIRIVFDRGAGPQTLYYFTANVENDALASQPAFLRFCQSLPRGPGLVKAASYLLHAPGFSRIRNFLLSHCNVIVQDDSGIPIHYFLTGQWTLRVFGNYVGPIPLFKQYYQPSLASLYMSSNPPSLPFGFGYQWRPDRSSLIIATARSGWSPLAVRSGSAWRPWGRETPAPENRPGSPTPHTTSPETQPPAPPSWPPYARGPFARPPWPPVFNPLEDAEE